MLGRTLPVRIVVPVENPEEREFGFDPLMEAHENRSELVAAAFTIVRAWWHVREMPEHRRYHRTLGSFDEWAQLVAAPVAWLTGRNPIELIEERKAQDHDAGAERAVIKALAERYEDRHWKAADAAKDLPADLRADAMPRLKPNDTPSANAVGYWLRQRRDRVYGRWVLEAVSDRNGVNDWHLIELAGDAGHAGHVPPLASEKHEHSTGEKDGNSLNAPQATVVYPPQAPHPPHQQQGSQQGAEAPAARSQPWGYRRRSYEECRRLAQETGDEGD